MAKEGSLEAPTRHPILWETEDFKNPESLETEMRRVADVCHGCRRCFNLCESFPRLFDLIDASETGEVEDLTTKNFQHVVDACTLCDMCFMTKCPYVPPHAFNIDFPHLMLRHRFVHRPKKLAPQQLAQTDRNGKLASKVPSLTNWASENKTIRRVIEKTIGIDQRAELPKFHKETLAQQVEKNKVNIKNIQEKVVLFSTCFAQYNNPQLGVWIQNILAKNDISLEVAYPKCCGMPFLEQGAIEKVAQQAKDISAALMPWVEKEYTIIAPIPSCALMLKMEWPLILPQNENIKRLSQQTKDICEFLIQLHHRQGFKGQLKPLAENTEVTLHMACHARAQNMGQKGAELLRLIPGLQVHVVEKCSGHGGTWGLMVDNFDMAMKVGKPAMKKVKGNLVTSECPLAGMHLQQGLDNPNVTLASHPLEIFAKAYDCLSL